MIRLIGFELYKIWSKTSYKILIIALLIINVYLIIYNNKPLEEHYSLKEYGKLNEDISGMSEDEKSEYINELYETIHNVEIVEEIKMYEAQDSDFGKRLSENLKKENADVYNKYYDMWKSKNYLKYTDNIYEEIDLIDTYYSEWQKTSGYGEYLENIKSQADTLSGISIFKKSTEQNDGFSAKNISKTADDYSNMENENIIFSGSEGLVGALDFDVTGYLIAITVFVIGSILVYEEKEKGLFFITKATIKGKSSNIAAKLIALSISTVVITFAFYATNIIYFASTTGLGDLFRNIQSVPEYMESTLDVTVLEFILITILSKCAVYITAGLIIMLIAILSSYSFFTLLAYIVIFGYGIALYSNISATSKWNWFKYLNIIGFLKTDKIFGHYLNMNLCGEAVALTTIHIVILTILICSLIAANIVVFDKKKGLVSKGKLFNKLIGKLSNLKIFNGNMKKTGFFKFKRLSILKFEIYKSGIMYKTILVLIIFGIFSFYKINEIKYYNTPFEVYYKNYVESIEGKLTNEKETQINNDKKTFDDAFARIDKIEQMEANGEIDEDKADILKQEYESTVAFYPAFCKVYEKYEKAKDNNKIELVYEKGYEQFFGIGSKNHLMLYLQINLVLILMLTPVFAMEYKNNLKKLIRTMPRGRKDTIKAKIIYSGIVSTIVFAIPIIKNIIIISNNYGMSYMGANINSIVDMGGIIGRLPIILCMILFLLAQLICTFVFMGIVLAVSDRCKNIVYGMLISACILVVPFVLIML